MNKILKLTLCILLVASVSGCENRNESEARDIFAAALQLENVRERNKAAILYLRIIEDYPKSKAAVEARNRIDRYGDQNKMRAQEALNALP